MDEKDLLLLKAIKGSNSPFAWVNPQADGFDVPMSPGEKADPYASTQSPFEVAAQRQRTAVSPPQGREEGGFTENVIPALGKLHPVPFALDTAYTLGNQLYNQDYKGAAATAARAAVPFAARPLAAAIKAAPRAATALGAGTIMGLGTGTTSEAQDVIPKGTKFSSASEAKPFDEQPPLAVEAPLTNQERRLVSQGHATVDSIKGLRAQAVEKYKERKSAWDTGENNRILGLLNNSQRQDRIKSDIERANLNSVQAAAYQTMSDDDQVKMLQKIEKEKKDYEDSRKRFGERYPVPKALLQGAGITAGAVAPFVGALKRTGQWNKDISEMELMTSELANLNRAKNYKQGSTFREPLQQRINAAAPAWPSKGEMAKSVAHELGVAPALPWLGGTFLPNAWDLANMSSDNPNKQKALEALIPLYGKEGTQNLGIALGEGLASRLGAVGATHPFRSDSKFPIARATGELEALKTITPKSKSKKK